MSRTAGRARTDVAFPFRADRRGRTAHAPYPDHVRGMVEQLLFTSPGERVMRPEYGCGLLDLLFAPHSPELAATVELSVRAAMERWLGEVIEVVDLDVQSEENTVVVRMGYVVRATGQRRDDVFEGRGAV